MDHDFDVQPVAGDAEGQLLDTDLSCQRCLAPGVPDEELNHLGAGLGRLFQSTSDQAGADRNMSSNARGAWWSSVSHGLQLFLSRSTSRHCSLSRVPQSARPYCLVCYPYSVRTTDLVGTR
jgi:hypothetical protein